MHSLYLGRSALAQTYADIQIIVDLEKESVKYMRSQSIITKNMLMLRAILIKQSCTSKCGYNKRSLFFSSTLTIT